MAGNPDTLAERANSAFDPVAGKAQGFSQTASTQIGSVLNIDPGTVQKTLPWLAGIGIAGAGAIFFKPIQKITGKIFSLFGLLDKVPVIGPIAKGIGAAAAYVVPVVAGAVGYKLLEQQAPPMPDATNRGYNHLGVVGAPSELREVEVARGTNVLASERVPEGPAAVRELSPQALSIITPMALDKKRFSEIAALRSQAVVEHRTELEAALEEHLAQANQQYANTRVFIHDAETYRAEPRGKLLAALKQTGFSEAEAAGLVPEPPRLQETVYKNGADFPPKLWIFADHFEDAYGPGGPHVKDENGKDIFTFVDKPGGKPERRRFRDLDVTQKEEYLAKAISFVEWRQDFFEKRKYTGHTGSAGIGDPGSTYDSYRYTMDRSTEIGNSFGMPWDKEHASLMVMTGARREEHSMSRSSKIITGEKLRETLEEWRAQQKVMDKHKDDLREANLTSLKVYREQVVAMDVQLHALKETGVAVLSQTAGTDNTHTLVIKDVRDAGHPHTYSAEYRKVSEGKFILASLARDGEMLSATPEIICDPATVKDWSGRIDAALKPPAARAVMEPASGTSLPSPSTPARPPGESPAAPAFIP